MTTKENNNEMLIRKFPLVNTILNQLNISSLSQIQQQVINHFFNAQQNSSSSHMQLTTIQSQAGTGKTLAYLIPLLASIDINLHNKLQGIIILPTRELALQTEEYFHLMHNEHPLLKYKTFIGGNANQPGKTKKDKLNVNDIPHILIGTIGKLRNILLSKHHKLKHNSDNIYSYLKFIIIDEADKMLHQNQHNSFQHFLQSLYIYIASRNSHVILCSASFTSNVFDFYSSTFNINVNTLTHITSTTVPITTKQSPSNIIEYYICLQEDKHSSYYEQKYKFVVYMLSQLQHSFNQCMLFYNQKGKGEELSNDLRSLNFSTVFIHGDLSQDQRVLIYKQIKRMKTKIIISTDLLSRGIDLTAVDFVINFDLPNCLVDYEHRVGRTGRFFTKGVAVSFVQKNEKEKYNLFINDSNNVSQVNDEFIIKVKNDFDNMKCVNNRLNDEEIQQIKSLATGIHINQNEVKLLQEKRRRSKYETQSIVHEWENVNTTTDNTDKEEQCTLNNTNNTTCINQPQCDNNNKFCLYCNLLKFLDV